MVEPYATAIFVDQYIHATVYMIEQVIILS